MKPWPQETPPVRRADALAKVTGRARFAADVRLPGMLVGRLLRSPWPHARIVAVRLDAARAVAGVRAVLGPAEVAALGTYGHAVANRPVLAQERVRYAGEPVAAVAAVTAEAAAEALDRIVVEYQPLPLVAGTAEALAAGAPALHPEGNVCARVVLQGGDLRAGFARAVRVAEGTWEFPSTYQYAMEPHTVVAWWRGRRLHVRSACQHPFLVRQELARLFGLRLAQVQVQAGYVGGGFGSKSYTKFEPVAAALAQAAQAPVLLEFSVAEAMLANRRHGARVWLRTGVDGEGHIVAREATVWLDTGAYADNGPRVAQWAARQLAGTYRLGAFRVEALAVYTNKSPAGSYRAIGQPQVLWAVENQMDQLAQALGVDPLQIRLRNLPRRGEQPDPDLRPVDADLPGDLQRLATAAGYRRGIGIGVGMTMAGASPVAVATVRRFADGSVVLAVGSGELGQGSRTVLAAIAGRELGVAAERVRVVAADTDAVPYDRSTGASRSTAVMGRAVQAACRDLMRRAGTSRRSEEAIGVGYSGPREGIATGTISPVMWETAMAMAEAEVDEETGAVRLRRYTMLADVGHALAPALLEGQEWGGALQGLGHTLMEALAWRDGTLVNANLIDYPVPGWTDIPEQWDGLIVENQDGPGPYGATGAGEGAVMPVASAVAGSLRGRYGLEFDSLPLTPERVWRALQERRAPAAVGGRPGSGRQGGQP